MDCLGPQSIEAWNNLSHPFKNACSRPDTYWCDPKFFYEGPVLFAMVVCYVDEIRHPWWLRIDRDVYTWTYIE